MLAAFAFDAGAAGAPVRPPDGTYVYRLQNGTQLAGSATVAVRADATHVRVEVRVDAPDAALARSTQLFDAAALRFSSYDGFVSTNGLDDRISLVASYGTVRGRRGDNPIAVSLSPPDAVVEVDDGLLGTDAFLPAQLAAARTSTFESVSVQSASGAFLTLQTTTAGPYGPNVPTSDVVATSTTGSVRLWYDPSTLIVDQIVRGQLTATLLQRPGQTS